MKMFSSFSLITPLLDFIVFVFGGLKTPSPNDVQPLLIDPHFVTMLRKAEVIESSAQLLYFLKSLHTKGQTESSAVGNSLCLHILLDCSVFHLYYMIFIESFSLI